MSKLMGWLLLGCLTGLLFPAGTYAGERREKDTGQGYVFAGFGAVNAGDSTLHYGGGGEAILYKGLGFGVEVGYLSPFRYPSSGIGILSIDGQYTFGTGMRRKVQPFLSGGYTLAFRSGTANAVNFGGGIHYWFKDRVGLRTEVRLGGVAEEAIVMLRVGLSFR